MLQNFLVSEKCSTFAMYLGDTGALSSTVQKFLQMEKKVFKVGQKVNYRIMPIYKYTVLEVHEDGTYDIADSSYVLGAKYNEGGSRIDNVDGSYLSTIKKH